MNKILAGIFSGMFCFITLAYSETTECSKRSCHQRLKDLLDSVYIVLDPGHDASTTGNIGATAADGVTQERVLNLEIAEKIKERLEKFGITNIALTRNDNTTIQNPAVKIDLLKDILAKWKNNFKNECESFHPYFISIHHNGLPSNIEGGTEAYLKKYIIIDGQECERRYLGIFF